MLELRGLACVRGERNLFEQLDCQIPSGHMLRVRGANGAGKTSLLRMICGLLPATQGQVVWRGESIRDLGEQFGRALVYIGHAAALKDDLSATENLQAACRLGGLRVSGAHAGQALAAAGLRGRQHMPVRQLSQGQRRRVALARLVLAQATPLWVLDEPFNALDTLATAWLCGLLQSQLERDGVVVLTSHQDLALDGLADRLIPLSL
ncbi:MAG: cytochrome c biogenesis heme-transporting ATPase CcmA [Burkholderiaceae bacterium]